VINAGGYTWRQALFNDLSERRKSDHTCRLNSKMKIPQEYENNRMGGNCLFTYNGILMLAG
jgi:hypothetical protein